MNRYRGFGLVSDRDEQLRRAFRDGFRRVGLAFPRLLEGLAWYRDRAADGADEARLLEAFSGFAAERGWSAEHRDAAIDIYRTIRDAGPDAVMDPAPPPSQDRTTISRAEDLLRSDPARYWADAEIQETMFEAQERILAQQAAAVADPPSAQHESARRRVGEIEMLLADPSGAGQRRYWNDAALRTDYGQALARMHESPGDADVAPPLAPEDAAAVPRK